MYTYLNEQGELYYIEVMENGSFIPIGDVTFCSHDMPIVIGNQEYRGKGIGKAVVGALIERAMNLGYQEILVREIYSYNIASQHLFESFGFTKSQTLKEGHGYKLRLMRS
jgi:RimJ/RimL family protein N-acetyltransferase